MFLFEYDLPFMDFSYLDKTCDYSDCFNRTAKMTEGGIEQHGYIDIKQPPKVKGRKLKSWKKKWVVLHEMSIRSAGRTAAKVDVYTDEGTARRCPADKVTFILEYVTAVRAAKSKKHSHAFEVVETEPVLLLAGETEYETQTWLTAFRKIFWPDQVDLDEFDTTIIQNEHTKRLTLEGSYRMTISPEVISIQSATCNSYEWSLRMLKRFNVDKLEGSQNEQVLTIECGPKSECGEASFQFRAENVGDILAAIKRNIFKAVNDKKSTKDSPASPKKTATDKPWRTSVTSSMSSGSDRPRSGTLDSEQQYRDLLESPVQETKRQRLYSESSDFSRRSSIDSASIPTKRTLSVTFEDATAKHKTVDEIMSAQDEVEQEGDTYNRVDLKSSGRSPGGKSNIITTFTVAKPGYQTKVLLDDKGYSHVGISASGPVLEDDKSRSLSNISSHSSVSFRSDSTNSGDSGCLQQGIERDSNRFKARTYRSTNSFDSAVSTSSTVDTGDASSDKPKTQTQTPLTVEIQELEMTAEELKREQDKTSDNINPETSIYTDVVIENVEGTEETKPGTPNMVKSRSFGDFKAAENHYEELESYRKGKKNLVKHLGMDPAVDPKSIPPALPARPTSHKVKRKFRQSERKLFTLPFAKNKSKKEKERQRNSSTSSDSDNEEGKSREELSISAWPLGNKSITVGTNEIYQPVAIERYLNDDEDNITPTTRERSSSLNLNRPTQMRRPSDLAEKSNKIWKHNRNVSMNVDLLQRMNDSGRTNLNTAFRAGFDHTNLLQTLESSENLCDKSTISERTFEDSDEPIYAEVQPISKDIKDPKSLAEPFPDMDSWEPHSSQLSNNCLDDTYYENDPMNKSTNSDVFNQGFSTNPDTKADKTADLIDLSVDGSADITSNKTSMSAVEIFSLGNSSKINEELPNETMNASAELLDLFTIGVMTQLPKSTTNLLNETSVMNASMFKQPHDAHSESVYMDMSSYKNESIYVMPSALKK